MVFHWLRNLMPRSSRRTPRIRTSRRLSPSEPLEVRLMLTAATPTLIATGTTATAVDTGDFNNDGKQDVIELNSSVAAVTVILGNGDGSFQAGVNSSAGGFGAQFHLADVNRDGNLDVLTNQSSAIDVLYGNGDGSFQLPRAYAVGAYAADFDLGDFNNDGAVDIVTTSVGYGGTSQVLLNNGDGTYGATQNQAIGIFGRQIKVADVNNDGNLDLVEENGSPSIGVLKGRGDGTFQSMTYVPMSAYVRDMDFSDLNHDGKIDGAVINGNTLSIFAGNGDGTFKAPTNYTATGMIGTVKFADLNNDGNSDVLASSGQVAFGRGDGTLYAPTAFTTAGAKIAVADFNGDGSADVVATNSPFFGGGVNVSLNDKNDASVLASAVGVTATAPSTVVAGQPFAVTVSVVDANGNIATGFVGTVAVSGSAGSQPVSYTFTAADAGVHTITTATTLFASGQQTVTVTSPFLPSTTTSLFVTPAATTEFSVTSAAATVAGAATTITVTATDTYGNPSFNYLGTVHLRSSDVQAGLPADYTFTAADNGTHTFAVTLKTAGTQTVSAVDTTTAAMLGTVTTAVTPAAVTTFGVAGGGGFIGSPHAVTVTARDVYGNVATDYNGTVHLVSSDPKTTVAGDATLTNGAGTITVTELTLGTQTLSVVDTVDGSLVGSESIVVTPGWAVRFTATPLAATIAGQTQGTTVTGYDAFGNVSTVFTGTVAVQTTDPQAGFSYYTFTAADAGVHVIPVTLKTAGAQTVTISDYANPTASVTQSGIQVTASTATSLSVTALHGTTAGVAQNFTVTLRDVYGNIATGYRGTLNFTSSDTIAALPAAYAFTAADAGVHTFSTTFKSSGGQGLTVTDPAAVGLLGMTSTQKDIPIVAGVAAAISARTPSNVTAGVAFNMTLSVVDAFGNTVTGYTGTLHISGPSGGGNILPVDYTFTAADQGTHVYSVTLASTGTQTLTFADKLLGSIKGSTSVKVVAAPTSTGGGGGGTTTGGGGGGGKKVV